jgi:hypothetical protein
VKIGHFVSISSPDRESSILTIYKPPYTTFKPIGF